MTNVVPWRIPANRVSVMVDVGGLNGLDLSGIRAAAERIATLATAGDPNLLIVSPQVRATLMTLALEGDQWRYQHRRGLRHYTRLRERATRPPTRKRHKHGR